MPGDGPRLITDLIYRVVHLLPSGQIIYTLPTTTTIEKAMEFLEANGFSQIPVVTPKSNKVIGVFSYRSFSKKVMELDGELEPYETYDNMSIGDFCEPFRFADPDDKWETIIKYLDRDDGILVGERDSPDDMGIITALDVIDFLRQISEPFVFIGEIELTIRRAINECIDDVGLQECIDRSLGHYQSEDRPSCVEEMVFHDYKQVICDTRNWSHFEQFFGNAKGQRRRTQTMLKKIAELRNDVFHFRRQLEDEELIYLGSKRDLLEQKAAIFEDEQSQAVEVEG